MRVDRSLRMLLALAVVLAFLLVLAAALFLTEKLFVVWEHLRNSSPILLAAYVSLFSLLTLSSGWLILRLLLPRKRSPKVVRREADEQAVAERLEAAEARGMDVAEARRELDSLRERRMTGAIYVALFGDISAGKSTLVRALLPGADVDISVRGGSTNRISHYTWHSPAGDRLILTDLPGMHEEGGIDAAARAEAARAHIVVYVCDGDLTRDQYAELVWLIAYSKPLVVALNKVDRYSSAELAEVRSRILARVEQASADSEQAPQVEVVSISAGGAEQIVRVGPEGEERTELRERRADVETLRTTLQRRIDGQAQALAQLRDSSVFVLVSARLDEAEAAYRREQAADLVARYTRRAVVGAMAAVAPGSDLLIQGVLGTALVREMCKLYDAPVRDIDTQQFLEVSQQHMGRTLPLVLAVTGNALKAFPGVGTIAGGLMHAVAYGLIFDSLGRSLATTLDNGGMLRALPAAQLFKETLGEDLEARTRVIAKLAIAARGQEEDSRR